MVQDFPSRVRHAAVSDRMMLRANPRLVRRLQALSPGAAVDESDGERSRTDAELLDSEERFQALASCIPHLVWIADADGNISWYNGRWHEYTGTTFEEGARLWLVEPPGFGAASRGDDRLEDRNCRRFHI